MSNENTIVGKCTKRLPKDWIKTFSVPGRPTLSYVSIDKTIKFLNDNFGDNWNVEITNENWFPTSPGMSVTVKLSIKEGDTTSVRYGIGANVHKGKNSSPDPDKICKTAYANALKKATNMFGFASELWDESNIEDDVSTTTYSETSYTVSPNTNVVSNSTSSTNTPTSLSEESKEYMKTFRDSKGLSKADMEEFLKEYKPESNGNPLILVHGNEKENVTAFCKYIEGKLKK